MGLFNWLLRKEKAKLDAELIDLRRLVRVCNDSICKMNEKEAKINNLLGNIDVSVDVHEYSRSWAAISIQGRKTDYIKFIDLGSSDIMAIHQFLSNFDRGRRKIDATPQASQYLKFP